MPGQLFVSESEKDKLRPRITKDHNVIYIMDSNLKPKIKEKEITKEKGVKIEEKYEVKSRETEEKILAKFDADLIYLIGNLATGISKFFFIIQGILAGVSVLNIYMLFFLDLTNASYIWVLSRLTLILFNFIFTLTFTSVVGAGVKSVNIYKTC
jgi:hypothetical protein